MSDLEIKLTGFKELQEALKALPGKVAKAALARSVYAGAAVVRQAARERARVGTRKHRLSKKLGTVSPGFLRKSIRISKRRSKDYREVKYAIGTGRAYYGMFLEFGTHEMAARPWLRPAFDSTTARTIEAIRVKLAAGIEKEASKLKK